MPSHLHGWGYRHPQARQLRVAAADQVTMPPHDRVRGHDQRHLPQPDPRQVVQQRRQEHPVGGASCGLSICRCRMASWWRNAKISTSFSVPSSGNNLIMVNTVDMAR
jgi:hypothetical protein